MNATAAVARLNEIYERNTGFLRDRFGAYVSGEATTTRIRATYPFVRTTTTTHARLDSRLSYGFVAGPGVYQATVTRPDLFRRYLTEQIQAPDRESQCTDRNRGIERADPGSFRFSPRY
jgi:AMP nucleosidase